jgi:hypothetical protein
MLVIEIECHGVLSSHSPASVVGDLFATSALVWVKITLDNHRSLRMQQKLVKEALKDNPEHKVFILISAHTDPITGMFDMDMKKTQFDIKQVSEPVCDSPPA